MKQHGNKNYVFKGYDWSELAKYFGVDGSDAEGEKIIDEKLNLIISELHGCSFKAHPDAIKIREYVSKLEKDDDTYKRPLWKGLLNIKEDGTFIKFVKILYKEMWN